MQKRPILKQLQYSFKHLLLVQLQCTAFEVKVKELTGVEEEWNLDKGDDCADGSLVLDCVVWIDCNKENDFDGRAQEIEGIGELQCIISGVIVTGFDVSTEGETIIWE